MSNFQYTSIIWLTQGKYAIVDNDDYEWLSQFKWYPYNGYAERIQYLERANGKSVNKHIKMHRVIINASTKTLVDHIDGNKLNNSKGNLRICTHTQNQGNRKATLGLSNYKGVTFEKRRNKWKAQITKNYRSINLGCYEEETDAAKAYNKAATEYFGEFARLNPI